MDKWSSIFLCVLVLSMAIVSCTALMTSPDGKNDNCVCEARK